MTQEHPEDWSPKHDRDDVEEAIATARSKAAEHPAQYAAGMRMACVIIEEELPD